MTLRQCLEEFLQLVEDLEAEDELGESMIIKDFTNLIETSRQYRINKTYPTSEGDKVCNSKKNRYKDILPFDYTRVHLSKVKDSEGSDYINANFIKGIHGDDSGPCYIASQGPLPHTVCDFWRMAWELKCQVIIMVCNEQEGGRPKCHRYWHADIGQGLWFGDVAVTVESEVPDENHPNDFLVRTLKVACGNEVREIQQFHYQHWPDHGITTSVAPILDLIALARQYQPNLDPPLLIHCSAGCGRTGTICAIDYAWNLLKSAITENKLNKQFNMKDVIAEMRKQRPSIVQAADQYVLVHKAVVHLFQLHLEQFDKYISLKDDEGDDPQSLYENWSFQKEQADDPAMTPTMTVVKDTVQLLYERHKSEIVPKGYRSNTDSSSSLRPHPSVALKKTPSSSSQDGPPVSPHSHIDLKLPPRDQVTNKKRADVINQTAQQNGSETQKSGVATQRNLAEERTSNALKHVANGDVNAIYALPPKSTDQPARTSKTVSMSYQTEEVISDEEPPPSVPIKQYSPEEVEQCIGGAKSQIPDQNRETKDYAYASTTGNPHPYQRIALQAAQEMAALDLRGAAKLPPSGQAGKPVPSSGESDYASPYAVIGDSQADCDNENDAYDYISLRQASVQSHASNMDDPQYASPEDNVFEEFPSGAQSLKKTEKGAKKKDKHKDKSRDQGIISKFKMHTKQPPPMKAITPAAPLHTYKKIPPENVYYDKKEIGFQHRVAKPVGGRELPTLPDPKPAPVHQNPSPIQQQKASPTSPTHQNPHRPPCPPPSTQHQQPAKKPHPTTPTTPSPTTPMHMGVTVVTPNSVPTKNTHSPKRMAPVPHQQHSHAQGSQLNQGASATSKSFQGASATSKSFQGVSATPKASQGSQPPASATGVHAHNQGVPSRPTPPPTNQPTQDKHLVTRF